VLSELASIFREIKPFQFSLAKIATFPNTIFLEPAPKEPFISLTKKVFSVFPDTPPYEGIYPEINPHLTIAQLSEDQDFTDVNREIIKKVSHRLPLYSVAEEAWLMEEHANGDWTVMSKFSF